ncbi:3-hydroxyacyl-CoA dehydrogenase family protein [Janibacter limosus]|uniref:3-hydroxyacyl-CoA dehydrogenase family protein n=1 Tax=Janibacter limosus TaxID=53458 RepID=A0AC61U5D2_9MICO|nr:3-hydroxyacyl-CoA dehydrogenase family protein [Janibacter limosus]UUZ45256.1 3-hydroxyacyl-CoA dehydrogenase family protein [Janibacter limosus]
MRVAVIGAGTMGSGIAQLTAMAGHETALVDLDERQLERALSGIAQSLERFVRKEKIDADESAAVRARLRTTTQLAEGVAGADVVIESVIEVLDVKQAVFRQVVEHAPVDALLGTNTSQLSITSIGAAIPKDAHRLVGMHFFNPPVMMRLVELVAGPESSEEAIQRAVDFGEALGKETVVCRKDSPGFLTSRISALVRLECLRMLEEGVASPGDIDKALRVGFNWPMGPLELGDFNGLDTYLHILGSLEDTLGDRFKPTVTLRNLVAAGRLGRKTGHGIYAYDESGKKVEDSGSSDHSGSIR